MVDLNYNIYQLMKCILSSKKKEEKLFNNFTIINTLVLWMGDQPCRDEVIKKKKKKS